MKELLPVGSVVLLKNAKKKLIVMGILQVNSNENKVYDYLGVPYPEGFIGAENNFIFNHEDVAEIFFTGYADDEREKFLKVMNILCEQKNRKMDGMEQEKEQEREENNANK